MCVYDWHVCVCVCVMLSNVLAFSAIAQPKRTNNLEYLMLIGILYLFMFCCRGEDSKMFVLPAEQENKTRTENMYTTPSRKGQAQKHPFCYRTSETNCREQDSLSRELALPMPFSQTSKQIDWSFLSKYIYSHTNILNFLTFFITPS